MSDFGLETARALLDEVFAPWIRDLGLSVEDLFHDGALLRLPFSDQLCREGGIVCGQALMALADTATVFAVAAASNRYRAMTTVDQTTHFLKPVSNAAVLCDARVIRLGRTMAFARLTLMAEGSPAPVATATTAYALLPDN